MTVERGMRKWRLIVRNVNFQCTEDDIRFTFQKFGDIAEIQMPQKKGRFAGFCFVQFKSHFQAVKAMQEINGTTIKDRIVAVDWSVPKDQYMTAVIEESRQAKSTNQKTEMSQVEEIEENVQDQNGPGSSRYSKESGLTEENEEAGSGEAEESESDEYDEEFGSDENDESGSDEDDESGSEDKQDNPVPTVKPKNQYSDVEQGCTVFVRGVPFDTNDQEFGECFENFGALCYAIICKFRDTDQSKGSGFVKFADKDSVDKCLQQANSDSGIIMKGRRLCVCPAMARDEAQKITMTNKQQKQEPVDKRNLHLLRIGLIRPGTKEAGDMSDQDAQKRLRIEASNRQKVKNLNIFVSPTRLVLHNLPTHFVDKQLKSLCRRAISDKTAHIKECRIMRDLTRKNADGVAKSRGYAFVKLDKHEHALECLKNLNNNATIFTDKKRPIVEFSLENRLALNAKMARLERSRENLHKKRKFADEAPPPSVAAEWKKRKLFVPPTVPPAPGCPKKPFPSHMGPKIRTKRRNKKSADRNEPKPFRTKQYTRKNRQKIKK